MARDDFRESTKRLIAERAGYVCSFPDCLAPTYGPTLDKRGSVNIGVAAHITAASEGGPRFDPSQSSDERSSEENGIWLCSTHASLIDRDVQRFSTIVLQNWKDNVENRALKMLGQPRGCSVSRLGTVSPIARVGAEQSVLVNNRTVPHVTIFDPNSGEERMTWFVNAFVLQFSIQKNYNRSNVIVQHMIVTVHETKPIPEYRQLMGVYPAEVNLYYVEIDVNTGTIPREFIPSRYYVKATDSDVETQSYPPPIVLDDNIPAHIALRFNAKTSAFYLISLDAMLSSGEEFDRIQILPPQWVIFERYENCE